MLNRFLMANEEPGDLLGSAETLIRELATRGVSKGNLESAEKIVGDLDINEFGRPPRNVIWTPYAAINRIVAGFREGELIVIGARPSAGKSTVAVEMALRASRDGHAVANFSMEMKKQAILVRAACNIGKVDNARLRHGRLIDSERHDFIKAMSEISSLPWFVDDRANTFAEMARGVHRMPFKPRLVIVDHLHLMRSVGRHENRNNELAGITRDLKLFAGQMSTTIILLAQLSRASEKENRAPEMRDLRDCGSIEADADIIFFLHRRDATTTEAERPERVPVDLLLAKQREGVAYMKIPLHLVGKYYKFEEINERSVA